MSLFGSLTSGVSGLTAQSSAMGAISDNITNVNTIGYKGTTVDFQTLVTTQTSSTFYSAGGVQSRPRQDTGVQGLLQSSTSQTDIAISGNGYFVTNEASRPTINNEYLYTRAGSFFQDNEGFLRNTSGFYLQAWPTDAAGNVIPANDDLTVANLNVISTDFLETVNLSRVGGTATATSTIAIGANLPSNDTSGTTHKTDVQFFDTLGNPNTMSFVYTRGNRENQWDLDVRLPQGVAVTTLEDADGNAYASRGQLEFSSLPADGATVDIDGTTYEFDTFGSTTASATNTFTIDGTNNTITAALDDTFNGLAAGDAIKITGAGDTDNVLMATVVSVSSDGTVLTLNPGTGVSLDDTTPTDTSMTIATRDTGNGFLQASTANDWAVTAGSPIITADAGTFSGVMPGESFTVSNSEDGGGNDFTGTVVSVAGDGSSITLNTNFATTNAADSTMRLASTASSSHKVVDVSSSTTTAQYVSALVSKVKASDSDFADHGGFTNNRITANADITGSASTIYFIEDGTGSINVDPSGLLTSTGAAATSQESSFTVRAIDDDYTDYKQFTLTALPVDEDIVTINGVTYEFDDDGALNDSNNVSVTIANSNSTAENISDTLTNLESAIESSDPAFAQGASSVRVRAAGNTNEPTPTSFNNTLVLSTLASGSYTVNFANSSASTFGGGASTVTSPDGNTTYTAATNFTIDKTQAITFDSDGLPSSFAVSEIEVLGFSSGAADMDDDTTANAAQMTLDLGTVGEADGFTQFGAEFTPAFIQQDGSQFGNFAGVTIDASGLMTALFDNGETRPVYRIPIATFVNVNGLSSRTGNVWNQTESSGDATLRIADNGPSGQIVQASLESSTVDIGEEFTKMIVVQRAYSASTRIISTADEMLEELVRIKR